jgi:methyl-accepting chemotaxis protein
MVEEASAAAASMNDQAARLSQLTAYFKLRDGYSGVPGSAEFIAMPSAAAAPTVTRKRASALPTERRTGARPWSKGAPAPAPSKPAAPKAAAAAKPAAGASAGNDWSEF